MPTNITEEHVSPSPRLNKYSMKAAGNQQGGDMFLRNVG
jgi:hypothetical protein